MSSLIASAEPALVTIDRAGHAPRRDPRTALEALLLRTLPEAPRAALVIGDSSGTFAAACAAARPACRWQREAPGAPIGDTGFDLVVLGADWCAAGADPLALLRRLHARAAEGAVLLAAVENRATLAMLQRWLEADLSDDADGPLARAHLRHGSPASFYKLLLDSGWLPCEAAATAAPPVDPAFAAAALALADSVGVPAATASRQLGTDLLAVRATRDGGFPASLCSEREDEVDATEAALFDVVVPVTRETQLRLNVDQSPGLAEVEARVVAWRRASSAAAALEGAKAHVEADWILFCHQDVYFPAGFGRRLNELLAGISAEERPRTLIGFAGMAVAADRQGYAPAGLVIDRRACFNHAGSSEVVSIDELAIVVARESLHRIDPALGWHLWATDLCLGAIGEHRVFPRIVRLPLFHNSSNDHRLPLAFRTSAALLAAKHPEFGAIATLCGTIDAAFLAAPVPEPAC